MAPKLIRMTSIVGKEERPCAINPDSVKAVLYMEPHEGQETCLIVLGERDGGVQVTGSVLETARILLGAAAGASEEWDEP